MTRYLVGFHEIPVKNGSRSTRFLPAFLAFLQKPVKKCKNRHFWHFSGLHGEMPLKQAQPYGRKKSRFSDDFVTNFLIAGGPLGTPCHINARKPHGVCRYRHPLSAVTWVGGWVHTGIPVLPLQQTVYAPVLVFCPDKPG